MKLKLAIFLIGITGGVAFMLVSTSGEAAHPHYQLTEFSAIRESRPSALKGRYMTVYGNVKEGTIRREGVTARFVVIQDSTELPVYFTGKTLLPDTFQDGAQAALDGTYDPATGTFMADKVMAKCASKYTAPESGSTMRKAT